MIEFLLFVIAWRVLFPEKQQYFYKEPTEQEQDRIQIVVIKTLLRYPDSPIGKDYPEIKYAVLSELYSRGEISKEYLHNEIDKII